MTQQRRGWRTSELTIAIIHSVAIFQLASLPADSIGDGLMRGLCAFSLAWVAGQYASARSGTKRGG